MNKKTSQKQILIEHFFKSNDPQAQAIPLDQAYVLTCLASDMARDNSCWPKQKQFAKRCKMSVTQLKRCIKELIGQKIISVTRHRYTNSYSFNEIWLEKISVYCPVFEPSDSSHRAISSNSKIQIALIEPSDSSNRAISLYKQTSIQTKERDLPVDKSETRAPPSQLLREKMERDGVEWEIKK